MTGFSASLEFPNFNTAEETLQSIAEAQGFRLGKRTGPYAVNNEAQGVASFGCLENKDCPFFVTISRVREPVDKWVIYTLNDAHGASCPPTVQRRRQPPIVTPSDSEESEGSQSEQEDGGDDNYPDGDGGLLEEQEGYENGYHHEEPHAQEYQQRHRVTADTTQAVEPEEDSDDEGGDEEEEDEEEESGDEDDDEEREARGFYCELSTDDSGGDTEYSDDIELPPRKPYVRSPSLPMPEPRKPVNFPQSAPSASDQASQDSTPDPANADASNMTNNKQTRPDRAVANGRSPTPDPEVLASYIEDLLATLDAAGPASPLDATQKGIDPTAILAAISEPLLAVQRDTTAPQGAPMDQSNPNGPPVLNEDSANTRDDSTHHPFPPATEHDYTLHGIDPNQLMKAPPQPVISYQPLPTPVSPTTQVPHDPGRPDTAGHVPGERPLPIDGVSNASRAASAGLPPGDTQDSDESESDLLVDELDELLREQDAEDSDASNSSCVPEFYMNESNGHQKKRNRALSQHSSGNGNSSPHPETVGKGTTTTNIPKPSISLPFDIYQIFPSYQAAEDGILGSSADQGLTLRVRWKPNEATPNLKGACFECIHSRCQYHIMLSDDQTGNWRVISIENFHKPTCYPKNILKGDGKKKKGLDALTSMDFVPKDVLKKMREKKRKELQGSRPFSYKTTTDSSAARSSRLYTPDDDLAGPGNLRRPPYPPRSSSRSSSSPSIFVAAQAGVSSKAPQSADNAYTDYYSDDASYDAMPSGSNGVVHSGRRFEEEGRDYESSDDYADASIQQGRSYQRHSSTFSRNSSQPTPGHLYGADTQPQSASYPYAYARKKLPTSNTPQSPNLESPAPALDPKIKGGHALRRKASVLKYKFDPLADIPFAVKAERVSPVKRKRGRPATVHPPISPASRVTRGPDGRVVVDILDSSDEEYIAPKSSKPAGRTSKKTRPASTKTPARAAQGKKKATKKAKKNDSQPQPASQGPSRRFSPYVPPAPLPAFDVAGPLQPLSAPPVPSPVKAPNKRRSPKKGQAKTKAASARRGPPRVSRWASLLSQGFNIHQCRLLSQGGYLLVQHLAKDGLETTFDDLERFRRGFVVQELLDQHGSGTTADSLGRDTVKEIVKELILEVRVRSAIIFECGGGMDEGNDPDESDHGQEGAPPADTAPPPTRPFVRDPTPELHAVPLKPKPNLKKPPIPKEIITIDDDDDDFSNGDGEATTLRYEDEDEDGDSIGLEPSSNILAPSYLLHATNDDFSTSDDGHDSDMSVEQLLVRG